MERPGSPRREYFWFAAILIASSPLLLTLCRALWRTPYPISETVALLEDYVDVSALALFDPTKRSWYRPLYHLTWWGLWRGTGSLDAALFWFKCVEVGAVVLLVTLFAWHLRARTLLEGAAAMFALAVLVGMPGFRENLEVPLLMTLVGMPLALIVWMLCERQHRLWHAPAILMLTLMAIGFKEQGLMLAPVVVAAWWTGAPGARPTTAALVVVCVVAYLGMRLATRAGGWPAFEQDVSLGFSHLSAREASDRFGAFPWWMYAYNATSTAANVLFSEPTDGQFRIVSNMIHTQLSARDINQLLSSMVLTGLIAWWGLGALKRDAGRPWSAESRLFIVTVLGLAASGALGFSYARDRLGGMSVVFYAIAAYFAVRAAGERALHGSRTAMVTVGTALLLLAGAWEVRAFGTIDEVRLKAAKNHREWITDMQERRREFANRPIYLTIMEAMAEQGLKPASDRRDERTAGSLADAIVEQDVERAYALIRAGQDPNTPIAFSHHDLTGDRPIMVSPLLVAVASHSENAVHMLLGFGARMDLPGNRFAACLAKQLEYEDLAEIIVRDGVPAGSVECPQARPEITPLLLAFTESASG